MRNKENINIGISAMIALIAPLFLSHLIYPMGKFLLPESNIILTPGIRVVCTFIMAIIDYALAYLFIKETSKHNKISFNLIFFGLTLLWNAFVGVFWYLAI